MQATALSSGVMFSRVQRASALGRPSSGLLPLRNAGSLRRARLLARAGVTVRAQLDDFEAMSHAADSLPSLLDNLSAQLTTHLFLLADMALPDAGAGAVPDVDPAAAAAAADATATAAKNSGFLGFFADAFESFLKVLDSGLESMGVPYSYGFAIIVLTLLVKLGTYPLTKKQVESTLALQALQPRVKELQTKYAGDNERLQVETAKLYQTAGVNPLAGCLPTLVTIPVFIGLYRALSNVADEGLLTEGFFWIPSLAGPTTNNGGLSWLLPGAGGSPPLGWFNTLSYLVLPILLVISQYISQKIISPAQNQNDPSQQQANAILKFMPIMIGWFSLNVPSGLTLYWFANNIITTAQQAYLRNKFQAPELVGAAAAGGTIVKPKQEEEEEDKRPTGKELNARRSPKQLDAAAGAESGQGEKFRAIKAREAAKKAAAEAAKAGSGAAVAASGTTAAPPSRGSKFAEIKAREAAVKAAAAAPPAEASSSNGSAAAGAAPAAAAASVAVVEPEAIQPEQAHQQGEEQQEGEMVVAEVTEVHAAAEPAGGAAAKAAANAAGKKGGKKGGKKK